MWCADFQAACRLTQPLPLPVGVHRFASDANTRLRSMRCSQEAAPVVLHYANCGYRPWLQKYQILAAGHGTEDGGFSIERKGIKSMRAHLAHRELLKRGNQQDLELYYRTYIMANEFGELPHFACHGMLARTHAVQHVLSEKCRAADAAGDVMGCDGWELTGSEDLHGAMPQRCHTRHPGGSHNARGLQRPGQRSDERRTRRPILGAVLS
eukprot:s164_g47.t2